MLNTSFEFWDYFIFGAYALMIIAVGLWVSRGKKGVQKTTEDYFLASKSLPWWAIGASLIAANISAEQFIGMSGSGFAVGLPALWNILLPGTGRAAQRYPSLQYMEILR